jgi:uncharacterized membrane protein YfcA
LTIFKAGITVAPGSFFMDFSVLNCVVLIVVGVLAGFINTLAGGGSNLTLPALMMMGLPADIANGTNRVAIFLQCLTAAFGFKRHNKLDNTDARAVVWPVIIGALMGALLAATFPNAYLKPVLLGTMLTMTTIMLLAPSIIAPPLGTKAYSVKDKPLSNVFLFLSGIYGGFVQAGVGFLLIACIAGTLRYDLVRTNALKMVCNATLTFVALVVFVIYGQVQWLPGLVLAIGTMLGAHFSVKIAIKASQAALKWFVFVMTLAVCAAAMLS